MSSDAEPKLPQLIMRFNKWNALAELRLPAGYQLHTLTLNDIDAYTALMNANTQLGSWTRERTAQLFSSGADKLVPEGSYFITFDGKPAATACTTTPKGGDPRYSVGWVAVAPGHEGKSLGYVVCLAVLHHMKSRALDEIYLLTDDHRLAAVKTYFKLGFEPQFTHESHAARWKALYEKLGMKGS